MLRDSNVVKHGAKASGNSMSAVHLHHVFAQLEPA